MSCCPGDSGGGGDEVLELEQDQRSTQAVLHHGMGRPALTIRIQQGTHETAAPITGNLIEHAVVHVDYDGVVAHVIGRQFSRMISD